MAAVKSKSSSNNLPIVIILIFVPIFFVFSVFLIFVLVNSQNKINNKDITVTLLEIKSYTSESAEFSLRIDGDQSKIIEKGFVYDNNPEPSLQDKSTPTTPLTEIFGGSSYIEADQSVVLSGAETKTTANNLYRDDTYFVRAYARTSSGFIYSNELSFLVGKDKVAIPYYESPSAGTTPQSRDARRLADVNSILNAILILKDQNPQAIPSYPKLSPTPQNLRIDGETPCTYSILQGAETSLSGSLKKIGYTIPTDPQSRSVACSDYGIALESNQSITITAPNAEVSVVKVNSANR